MGAVKKLRRNYATTFVAEKRADAPKQVLVAKPRKGPIDYAALRKSAIARFSKTLARLAE